MSLKTVAVGTLIIGTVIAVPITITLSTPPIVTLVHFERLAPGMDAAAAERLIGQPGEVTALEQQGGTRRRTVAWTNADGSSLTAVFEEGRLVSKSAERLR